MDHQVSNPTTLPRTLGLKDLILLIIGTVIGSGIFIVPGAVLRQTGGSITLAMLVWLAGGILSLLGALTYGELSAMNPKAGGLYIFIRDGFGSLPAFLYGWTLFFVISSGSVATLAVAFSSYLGEIVPLSPLIARIAAIAMIVVVTIVNVLGTRESANLQDWTTTIKVGAILLMSAVIFALGDDRCLMGLRRLAVRNLQRGRNHNRAAQLSPRPANRFRRSDRHLPARE